MKKSDAIGIINSRTLITEPGKYSLRVTNVAPFEREDGTIVRLVNLNGMTEYQLAEAKKALAEGTEEGFQEATNQSLTASQRVGKDYVPAKGEIVDVVLDTVTTKNDVTGLFIVSLTAMPTKSGSKVNLLDEDEVEVTADLEAEEEVA